MSFTSEFYQVLLISLFHLFFYSYLILQYLPSSWIGAANVVTPYGEVTLVPFFMFFLGGLVFCWVCSMLFLAATGT